MKKPPLDHTKRRCHGCKTFLHLRVYDENWRPLDIADHRRIRIFCSQKCMVHYFKTIGWLEMNDNDSIDDSIKKQAAMDISVEGLEKMGFVKNRRVE